MKHEVIEKNAGLLGVLVGSAAHWHVPVDRWADPGAPGREHRTAAVTTTRSTFKIEDSSRGSGRVDC